MKSKKSTGELLHEIATTKQDFESFANENKDEFDEFDSRDYLNRLLNMKNLQPTDIIRRSGLERSYVYQNTQKSVLLYYRLSVTWGEAQSNSISRSG